MSEDQPGGRRRIDRVTAEGFLDDLRSVPMDEVRRRRQDAEQEATDLSYLRRLLQGRIDIIAAELARREGGEGGSLLAELPRILADDRGAPQGLGRHSASEPSRAGEHRRHVESLVGDVDLSDVSARTDDELRSALDVLRAEEASVSGLRRTVHAALDACNEELARRYRDGEADVADLLSGSPG